MTREVELHCTSPCSNLPTNSPTCTSYSHRKAQKCENANTRRCVAKNDRVQANDNRYGPGVISYNRKRCLPLDSRGDKRFVLRRRGKRPMCQMVTRRRRCADLENGEVAKKASECG